MKALLLVALVLIMSCGLVSGSRGADAGAGGGAGQTGGGTAAAGGGGDSSGGGSGATGGAATGGGATGGGSVIDHTDFDFVSAPAPEFNYPKWAMSGHGTELYVVAGDPVLRWTGTAFVEITGFAELGFDAVYVTSNGTVFISNGRHIGRCTSGCDRQVSYVFETMPVNTTVRGLCGTGPTTVYAAAEAPSPNPYGKLLSFNGTSWTVASSDLGIDHAAACSVDANGAVWIAGIAAVAKFYNGALSPPEGADLSALPAQQRATQQFLGIVAIGGWVHAVGIGRRIMSRSPAGTWTLAYDPPFDPFAAFFAVAGSSANNVFAVGHVGDTNHTVRVRFDGLQWAPAPTDSVVDSVTTLWVPSDNELWLGGTDSNSLTGYIRRGTR